jgi:hypothetical protein
MLIDGCDEIDLPCDIIEQMNRTKKESETQKLFDECESIIGDRGQDYGEAKESFSRIAGFWSAYLKIEVSAKDVALMLSLFKIAREQGNPKRDNIVDGINYLALSEQL